MATLNNFMDDIIKKAELASFIDNYRNFAQAFTLAAQDGALAFC